MLHTWATNTDDPTVQPRWGKIGKQKIEDAGALCPERMETVDDEILANALKFVDKAKVGRQALLPLAEPDAHARRHAPFAEVPGHAQLGERLVDPGSRHGAARRHRRLGHEVRQGQRPRRRHDHRLLDRQRRRELHLARRRPDAVRGRQGYGPRGRFPRAGDDPVAGQDSGRQDRERHRLGARLVPDLRFRGGKSEHHRGAHEGQGDRRRRTTRCTSTATIRRTC